MEERRVGRELKRVPLNFDHPIGEIWPGYLSPDYRECPSNDCDNGSTLAGAWLEAITHLLMMSGETGDGDRERPLHPWLEAVALRPDRRPGPQMAELTVGLAGRQPVFIGHDAIDRWSASKKIIAAAGLPEGWGTCDVCEGSAQHPDDKEAAEAWEPTDPPTGEGYQMWGTTSEGNPMTPVFETLRELAEYCSAHCTTFASMTASVEGWEQMLGDGLVAARSDLGGGNTAIWI